MSSINFTKVNSTSVNIPTVGKFNFFFDIDGLPKYVDSDGLISTFGGGSTESISSLTQDYDILGLSIGDKQKQFNGKVTEILSDVMTHPVYVQPVLSIPNLPAQFAEIGKVAPISISSLWNQNDAGNVVSMNVFKNNVSVSNTLNFNENLVLTNGQVSYKSSVQYNIGAVKNNIYGIPDPIGRILAGSINSNTQSIYGIYPIFFGVFEDQPIASTVSLVPLEKLVVLSDGNITISVDCEEKYFLLAVPNVSTEKTKWFISEISKGSIGGSTNLFGDASVYNKNSPDSFWNNVPYRFYVTNYRTTFNEIQLRNS